MKPIKEQKLITKQISRRLEELREVAHATSGVASWIDYVRSGLGIGLTQLAHRLEVAQSSISESIKSEKEGRITLQKLKQIADAMDCDLVYGFVPRKRLEDIMLDQAIKKTQQLMNETETHMELEDQKVQRDKNERLQELAQERLYSKYLWDK
jgi:predicted DNA-binding mobile mystery protein A